MRINYLFKVYNIFINVIYNLLFYVPFVAVILAHCDKDQERKRKKKRWKNDAREKERSLSVRPWSHTCAAHVRIGKLRRREWEIEGARKEIAATERGDVKHAWHTREMRKFHIPEERKEAVPVAYWRRQRRCERSAKALFRSRIHGMETHRRQEPTRQRYQANARERDRTHRWRSILHSRDLCFSTPENTSDYTCNVQREQRQVSDEDYRSICFSLREEGLGGWARVFASVWNCTRRIVYLQTLLPFDVILIMNEINLIYW